MKSTRLAWLPILIVVLVSSAAQTRLPGLEKVRVLTLLGRPLQFAVADSQGIFTKYGIEAEHVNKSNSDELRSDLAVGKGDLAYLAVDNAVAMVELSHQDVIIVMGGQGSQNELIAQPTINSIKDLHGKTLIVDAPNTAYALQLKKILSMNGLQAVRDYEIKPYGTTPARFAALREHKEFAGSMLGPPASIAARREGFVTLGSVPELIGRYQAEGFFTQRAWAEKHRVALIRFLAACIEAQRWMMDPSNKEQVLELLMTQGKLQGEVAAQTYDSLMTRPGGYEKDAGLDLTGLQNVLKLRAEVEGQWGGHPPNPEKYYNPLYYEAALAKVKKTK